MRAGTAWPRQPIGAEKGRPVHLVAALRELAGLSEVYDATRGQEPALTAQGMAGSYGF